MSDFESARAVSKGVSFASILAVEAEERNKKDSGSDILPWYSDKVVVETRDYQEATAEMVQHNKALQVAQCGDNGVITELKKEGSKLKACKEYGFHGNLDESLATAHSHGESLVYRPSTSPWMTYPC